MTILITTFTIRKKVYEVYTGDYILFNGACYQFCTGNKRALGFEGYHSYYSIPLTAKVLKSIDLNLLQKVEIGHKEDRSLLTYYYF